ncbi:MAG TPA: GxxExxY protein [Planctomycetaceae bacterium]|nr:GxxExxY protein [Planctomycetaceae bacterium]
MSEDELNALTEQVIGCAFRVSNTLGSGFLEKVYENSLAIELRKARIDVRQQAPISVKYEGTVVGEYFADLLVSNLVIVELKAVKEINDAFAAQCLNYLKATGLPICLLLNFGKPRVEIKRLRL